jgi:L-amino acid N-acyltransferase YncA
MLIREARPEDADAIATIHVRSWQAAYAGLLPREALAAMSIPDRADRWRSWLEPLAPGVRVWVADEDGRIIGFSSTGPSRDSDAAEHRAEVYTIYLAPDVVGTGRGRALFAHAMEELRRTGSRSAELWVLTRNERARRFYEAAGWHTDGEEKTESLFGIELRETRYRIEL